MVVSKNLRAHFFFDGHLINLRPKLYIEINYLPTYIEKKKIERIVCFVVTGRAFGRQCHRNLLG